MYYVLEFMQPKEKYRDLDEAKQLVNSYKNIKKFVNEGDWRDWRAWQYYLGSNDIQKLEDIVKNLFKSCKDKELLPEIHIRIFRNKKQALNIYYDNKQFY